VVAGVVDATVVGAADVDVVVTDGLGGVVDWAADPPELAQDTARKQATMSPAARSTGNHEMRVVGWAFMA
jgi:hypothetical protein